jgi:hypothetical protein
MRRTKITAFIAVTVVSAVLLTLGFTPLAGAKPSKPTLPNARDVSATFVGVGGMVFRPGQTIEIKWILQGEGVKYFETNPWGECELFFSPDNGANWTRFTPHMAVTARSFQWTIPNTPTTQGLFALQIGIEGEGDFFMFPSQRFTISNVSIGKLPSQ